MNQRWRLACKRSGNVFLTTDDAIVSTEKPNRLSRLLDVTVQ
jgi:hypothetical protein